MNKDILEGKWKQIKGKAQEKWGKLTHDELDQVNGNLQKLTGLVQERYGKTREAAEEEVKRFYDDNP